MSLVNASLVRGGGGGSPALTLSGSSSYAPAPAGVVVGSLLAPGYTVFSLVAGSAKLVVSALGQITTNNLTVGAESLVARFRAATADGLRAIEETFTFLATGAAPVDRASFDFNAAAPLSFA